MNKNANDLIAYVTHGRGAWQADILSHIAGKLI